MDLELRAVREIDFYAELQSSFLDALQYTEELL